jgi:hypothetical protein
MEPDPFDLPTSPSISPVPPPQSSWPGSPGDQRPGGRPQWTLLAVIGAGLTLVVILALLLTLLLSARGRAPTGLIGAAADQTATAISVQATATAGETPDASATGTAAPHATATPRPPSPTVHIVANTGDGSGVNAMCPSGELALTGGWGTDPSAPINYIGRSTGNGWRVHSFADQALVNANVLCLQHVAGASITERFAGVTAAVGATGTGVATCHASEIPVGGGFNIPGGDIVSLGPTADHSGFSLKLANHTSSTLGGSISVDCLRAAGTHLTVPEPTQAGISPHGSGPVQISCPKGTLLSGGGIDLLNGSAVAFSFAPTSATTWQALVQNQTVVSTTVKLYALCLSFS